MPVWVVFNKPELSSHREPNIISNLTYLRTSDFITRLQVEWAHYFQEEWNKLEVANNTLKPAWSLLQAQALSLIKVGNLKLEPNKSCFLESRAYFLRALIWARAFESNWGLYLKKPLLSNQKQVYESQVSLVFFADILRGGGAVAEWSKALLKREKINENQKIPGLPPDLGTFKKN